MKVEVKLNALDPVGSQTAYFFSDIPCQTMRSVYGPEYDAVLLCQIFLANTDRLLNSAVHKRQNYDQMQTVVSIDLGSSFF